MTFQTISRVALTATVVAVLAAQSALAQGRRNGPGMPRYDVATETTVHGVVSDVQLHQGRGGGGQGLHLAVQTEQGTLDVHVGPVRWLTEQHYEFTKGDALDITGSTVKVNGADAFLAREIRKGDLTMTLRNAQGIPRWSRAGSATN